MSKTGKEIYDEEYPIWEASKAAGGTEDSFATWLSHMDPSGESLVYMDTIRKAAEGPIEPEKQEWPNRTTGLIDKLDAYEERVDRARQTSGPTKILPRGPGAGGFKPVTSYSHSRWDAMIDETFEEVRHLAKAKGGEYSGDVDRLLNFRRNGADLGLPMEVIWRVYAAKHWDAVGQYIRDIAAGKKRERLESIDGRIRDLIVYLLLFQAMVEERNAE